MTNKIFPYRSDLKERARYLRKHMTFAEQEVWKNIRKKSLGVEFHRQVPILDYIVDFYCHEIGLVIEVDGTIHDHQVLEDGKRQARLEALGLTILRFKNEEVFENLEAVLIALKDAVQELQ